MNPLCAILLWTSCTQYRLQISCCKWEHNILAIIFLALAPNILIHLVISHHHDKERCRSKIIKDKLFEEAELNSSSALSTEQWRVTRLQKLKIKPLNSSFLFSQLLYMLYFLLSFEIFLHLFMDHSQLYR